MERLKTSFEVDKGTHAALMKIIKRRGMSFSSWVRVMMSDTVEAERARGAVLTIEELENLR